MAIDPRFIINLKGRDYPLWAGILDLATRSGLRCLETEVIQVPTPENGNLAVVMATATFDGPDGRDRLFTDVGDCSPASTSPQLAAAALRLASTRAKGRALRDAVNVGQTMYEELPNEEFETSTHAPRLRENGSVDPPVSQPAGAPPAAPLPVARHAPGTVGRPPTPGGAAPGPVVVPTGGALCNVCGQVMTAAQVSISQKHFSDLLCPRHQREAATSVHIKAQTTNGALECSNPGCSKPLTQGQHDVSLRSYGQALCPSCQKQFARIG